MQPSPIRHTQHIATIWRHDAKHRPREKLSLPRENPRYVLHPVKLYQVFPATRICPFFYIDISTLKTRKNVKTLSFSRNKAKFCPLLWNARTKKRVRNADPWQKSLKGDQMARRVMASRGERTIAANPLLSGSRNAERSPSTMALTTSAVVPPPR